MSEKNKDNILNSVVISPINLFESFGSVPGLPKDFTKFYFYYKSGKECFEKMIKQVNSITCVFILDTELYNYGERSIDIAGGLKICFPKSLIYELQIIGNSVGQDEALKEFEISSNFIARRNNPFSPINYLFIKQVDPKRIETDLQKIQ